MWICLSVCVCVSLSCVRPLDTWLWGGEARGLGKERRGPATVPEEWITNGGHVAELRAPQAATETEMARPGIAMRKEN